VQNFETIPVKVYKSTELIAFFVVLVHDGKATLPFFYCNTDAINKVRKIIYKVLINKDISVFTSYQTNLNDAIRKMPNPFIHIRSRTKVIAFSKEFGSLFVDAAMQDGDGDCAFI
jgi:hypothetical protein